MTWVCGECGTKWPDSTGTCIACLQDDLRSARAVVAVQHEALRVIAELPDKPDPNAIPVDIRRFARAALDAEGVSEPGAPEAIGDSWPRPVPGSLTSPLSIDERIRRAEGVSEPGHQPEASMGALAAADRGSLTSPVDRDVCECGHGKSAHPYVGRIASWPTRCMYCGCQMFVPVATSPVDTAPRGYVTASADGPVGVYHAETPDTYLEHGDR